MCKVHTVCVLLVLREVTPLTLYSVNTLLRYKQLTIYSAIVLGIL